MKSPFRLPTLIVIGLSTIGSLGPIPAHATSTYSYGPDEYVVISDGTSPDRRFSVAAHGHGDSDEDFHLFLMGEPGHKKIGLLEEIGPEILDTGAAAYRAVWSTDSRHVAVFYRVDRHDLRMVLYRIENRRAYPVVGPTLLAAAMGGAGKLPDNVEETANSSSLTWLSPTRFVLKEQHWFKSDKPDILRTFGRYGKDQSTSEDKSAGQHVIQFSAEAECNLGPGDGYRTSDLKPGRFDH
jgi:hypothetical protein